jgi:hypothetical protein
MSVLETPRILFRGEISWDPVTTNNYSTNYDEDDCTTIFASYAKVSRFRQSAIDQVNSDGNWNPHGTHRSAFFNTFISGVDTGAGVATSDTFCGAPVEFSGMLVDCEPYGSTSSQLFFDAMSFGIPGGCRIFGRRVQRFHDRYINFSRNPANNMIAGVASVMWQNCFPKDAGLVIDAHDSLALQALQRAVQDPDVLGVTVRWNSYRTVYFDDPTLSNGSQSTQLRSAELVAKLNGGGWQPNPARSLLVGVVGLWRRGEPVFEAGDRALLATGAAIPGQTIPRKGGPAVASAHARLSGNAITLDLSNCIPEVDRVPNKIDMNTLSVVAVDPNDKQKVLATLGNLDYSQYDKAAYESGSGIVTLPVSSADAAIAAKANLQLRGSDGSLYLDEAPIRAIPSQPNIYIDQGEKVQSEVRVYDRGQPAAAGIEVIITPVGASSPVANSARTDANGRVNFPLSGSTASVTVYALFPQSQVSLPVAQLNTQVMTFMTVRVLPADNGISQLPPTWQNVHQNVLSNWEAMAPCMDNWLKLGDETQVARYAPMIRKLTNRNNFESYRYMPVVRDMTLGQRTLLMNYLEIVNPTLLASATGDASASAEADAPDFLQLSRAMRGNP